MPQAPLDPPLPESSSLPRSCSSPKESPPESHFFHLRSVSWRIDLGIFPSSPTSSIDDLRRVAADSRQSAATTHVGGTDGVILHSTEVSSATPFPSTAAALDVHVMENTPLMKDSGAVVQTLLATSVTERLGSGISVPSLTTGDALDEYQLVSQRLESLTTKDAREAETQGVVAEVPEMILKCVSQDEATLAVAQKNKWMELSPTIISKARTIQVHPGMAGNRSGSLQLMYEELQVLSPLVPTREFYFLRYCQQIEQGMWAIADVSIDYSRVNQFVTPSRSRGLPSGCLIHDMPNGYSKITWMEHVEIEEKSPIHRSYRELINGGMAFGAQRWVTTLQRMRESLACLMVTGASTRALGGGVWVTVHKPTDPGQPNGVVLSAATSLWLPVSPQTVFNFFKDERTRPQWDFLSHGNSVQEVAHIANGSHPGNCISVLRVKGLFPRFEVV